MNEIVIDESRWPIVIVTYRGDLDVSHMKDHFDDLRALIARDRRYLMLSDFTEALPARDPVSRRIAGQFVEETAEASARLCVAVAYATPSRITRGILTAVSWYQKAKYPTKYFDTVAEGLAWLEPFAAKIRQEEG